LRAASSGDQLARSRFARDYLSIVRQFLEARWRGRALGDQVEDAAQEVFLECLKPGGTLERAEQGRGSFRGLLFAVTRNVARRYEKHAMERGPVRPAESAWLQQIAADDTGQATLFERSWARSLLLLAKRRHVELANADGEAGHRRIELLERRFGGDETIRHIAARWGVPSQEVHNAYRKAREEFRHCLRQVVRFHSPEEADVDAECRRLLGLLR